MNTIGETGNQVMLFVFLFFVLLIGIGISTGILIFFGGEYGFKQMDSDVLNYKISECLIDKSIDFSVFDVNGFPYELYEKCGFDEKVLKENYAIQVKINNLVVFSYKNPESCKFRGGKENPNFPKCTVREFKKDDKTYEVLTGSYQTIRRTVG